MRINQVHTVNDIRVSNCFAANRNISSANVVADISDRLSLPILSFYPSPTHVHDSDSRSLNTGSQFAYQHDTYVHYNQPAKYLMT